MKKYYLNNRGVTLIEMLIYISIFSIIVIAIASFAKSLSATRLSNQMVFEVNDQGSQAIKIITQTLRSADEINSPTIGNSAQSLSIVTQSAETSPTVFSMSSGTLYITEGTGLPVALTNNKVVISGLTFSNFSRPDTPDIIKINFNLTATSTGLSSKPYSADFAGSGALRK